MWGNNGGTGGGSSVTPSHTNGNIRVNGQEVEVYNDSALEQLATHDNRSTLDRFSDDGTKPLFDGQPISGGSQQVSVNGRPYFLFSLRGGVVKVRKNILDNAVTYTFPTGDANRLRRMFVWKGAANGVASIDILDGTLQVDQALIYNVATNALSVKTGTWGNVQLTADEVILLYNSLGIIGGVLSKYVVYGGDSLGIPIREIEAQSVSNTGSTQGIFIVGDNIYKCAHSDDEHTNFVNIAVVSKANPNTPVKTITHNMGHMNAPNYSAAKDALIVGNGSKDFGTLPLIGWIIPNFSTVVQGSTIDFSTVDKVELDFSHITGEFKCQLCWGYESQDIVYMFTSDSQILRKVLLGKGSENLGAGTFVAGKASNEYNGSYSIQNTWRSRTSDTLGGMLFYKGNIYIGVKGENCIRKCIPLSNGYFDSEYIPIPKQGDMQGLAISDNEAYAFTDYKGYKFSVNEL